MKSSAEKADRAALECAYEALLEITATLGALSPIKDKEQEYSRQKAIRRAAAAALHAKSTLRGF